MPTRKTASQPAPRTATRAKSAQAVAARPAARRVDSAKPPRTDRRPAPTAATKSVEAAKAPKPKAKLVRDSFTMPQADFALVAALKDRALEFKRPTKKSELLRAGLQALVKLDDKALRAALDALTPLTPGRPKKND